MKKVYLILAIIGFILPNIFVTLETVQTGNILLYSQPLDTFKQMFINNVSTAFIIDLLYIVILFFIWSYSVSKKANIKRLWIVWATTLLFGLAFGLPYFMYLKEKAK